MKRLVPISLIALTAGCMAEGPVGVSEEARTELAEAIEGRVAGEPLSCVSLRDLRGNRSAGSEAIIFEGRGDVIYINRPPAGCPDLDHGRALLVDTTMSQLCQGEIVRVFDPVSGINFGGCGLGEFVPYREID